MIILNIIAFWKLFVKADEKGWKSIIPFYNTYVAYRLFGLSTGEYVLFILSAIAGGVLAPTFLVAPFAEFVPGLIAIILWVIYACKACISFGHDTDGFKIGTVFLPFIFFPVMAFGKSTYLGPVEPRIDTAGQPVGLQIPQQRQVPQQHQAPQQGQIPESPDSLPQRRELPQVDQHNKPQSHKGLLVKVADESTGSSYCAMMISTPLYIGRNREKCKLALPAATVSRVQAALAYHHGQMTIRDCKSKSGTYVGKNMASEPIPIQSGSRVKMGGISYRISWKTQQ